MKKFILIISLLLGSAAAGDLSAQKVAGREEAAVAIYPNPTHGDLTIRTSGTVKIKSLSVFSLLGTPLLSYEYNQPMVEVNLDKLKPGKYFLRYTLSDNTERVKQIIKQ